LIDLYYKQRDDRPDAINFCIDFCLLDINSIEQFIALWHQQVKSLGIPDDKIETPRIPSFERLSIIYDKQGRFLEAIEICKKAIELNLQDSTKGGFSARLALLEKKLNKQISE
jgi:tetratricopeptide (TPR) repeat protein